MLNSSCSLLGIPQFANSFDRTKLFHLKELRNDRISVSSGFCSLGSHMEILMRSRVGLVEYAQVEHASCPGDEADGKVVTGWGAKPILSGLAFALTEVRDNCRDTQRAVLAQSKNISLLPMRFMNTKHNFKMYFCDYNLTNYIKCIKKSRPNFSSALLASDTATLLRDGFIPISRNEYLWHQNLFTGYSDVTFRHFKFREQEMNTRLEFKRECSVSISFVIRKEI